MLKKKQRELLQKATRKSEKSNELFFVKYQDLIRIRQSHMPENCTLWIATLDDKIDDHSYIVPGLGDAGDLAYGEKL